MKSNKNDSCIKLFILIAVMAFILGCTTKAQEETINPTESYVYHIPESIAGDLEVGSINDTEIDPDKIAAFFDEHINGRLKYLHGLLILKNGKLVVEEYFAGEKLAETSPITWEKETVTFNRTTRHYVASVTKSFISALIGICIDRQLIPDVDQPIIQYFPEYQHFFDNGKFEITIKHLLGMKSGISWSNGETEDTVLMINSDTPWVEYILSRPMVRNREPNGFTMTAYR
ncbi:MAG: serine hydrolase [bacterium]|nr:serine hydrolase [bacterium]